MNSRLILSVFSVLFSLLSLFVTPTLVFLNYSMLSAPDMSLERAEANIQFTPYVYFTFILGAVSCGIAGFARRPFNRTALVLSALGLVLTVLSLIFFSEYMLLLWNAKSAVGWGK